MLRQDYDTLLMAAGLVKIGFQHMAFTRSEVNVTQPHCQSPDVNLLYIQTLLVAPSPAGREAPAQYMQQPEMGQKHQPKKLARLKLVPARTAVATRHLATS